MKPTPLLAVFAGLLCLVSAASTPARRTQPAAARATAKPAVAKASKPAKPVRDPETVQRWLTGLSAHDLVAQLIVAPFYGDNPNTRNAEYKRFASLVRDTGIGGLIIINKPVLGSIRPAEPYEMASFLNRMQRLAKIPLIVGGDFERGASMRVTSSTKYPHAMAFGAARDLSLTRYEGAATAREARSMGVHWIFAPDADVNNNPLNPIINIRSFGENPQDVAANVKAYIEGAHSDPATPVMVTVKHFPGHGDTTTDSHMGLGVVSGDRARLESVELVPFRAAIASSVDAVMTAHLTVPAVEPEEIPATVSAKVLTDLLRKELKFDGIIVTDAMDMQGLTKQFSSGEAAVRALEAGADVLLMPVKPEESIAAVLQAMRQGRLTRQRVEASVTKLLRAKVNLGLHRTRLVNVQEIAENIDSPEASERAQEVANRAVTLVRNDKDNLPLREPASACVYVLAESRGSQQGRLMVQELQKRANGIKSALLDPRMTPGELQQLTQANAGCKQQVVIPFVTVGAYRGDVALAGSLQTFVEDLIAAPAPVTMIAMGNPYLLKSFPTVSGYVATFSTAPTAEIAAVKALLGEIPLTGKLPVTIPGLAKYGDGIALPARDSAPPANQ